MNISNNNQINFKSRINIVNTNKFWDVMGDTPPFKKFVEAPWTPKEMQKGPYAWTEEIRTCTAGGIVTKNIDGSKDVLMFHFNPDEKICNNFIELKESIIEKIGNSKPIQALLVGSKDTDGAFKYSGEYFDKIEEIIKQMKLPFSKFKGTPMGGYEANILYDAPKDTWTILNTVRNNIAKNDLSKKSVTGFKDVVLSKLDFLNID